MTTISHMLLSVLNRTGVFQSLDLNYLYSSKASWKDLSFDTFSTIVLCSHTSLSWQYMHLFDIWERCVCILFEEWCQTKDKEKVRKKRSNTQFWGMHNRCWGSGYMDVYLNIYIIFVLRYYRPQSLKNAVKNNLYQGF